MKKPLTLLFIILFLTPQAVIANHSSHSSLVQLGVEAPTGCQAGERYFISVSTKHPQETSYGILEEVALNCEDFPLQFQNIVVGSDQADVLVGLLESSSRKTALSTVRRITSHSTETFQLTPVNSTLVTIKTPGGLMTPTELRFQRKTAGATQESYWLIVGGTGEETIQLPAGSEYLVEVSTLFDVEETSFTLSSSGTPPAPVDLTTFIPGIPSDPIPGTPGTPNQPVSGTTGQGTTTSTTTPTVSTGGGGRRRTASPTDTPSTTTTVAPRATSSTPTATSASPSPTPSTASSGGGGGGGGGGGVLRANPPSTFTVLTPEAATQCFPDISVSQQAYICDLKNRGVISGNPDGSFKPQNKINRAEYLKILLLSAFSATEINVLFDQYQTTPVSQRKNFPDVPLDAWFAPYVYVATTKGIIAGYPDGTFQPTNETNQAEASKIALETFREKIPSLDRFLDSYQFSEVWFQKYLDYITQAFDTADISQGVPFKNVNRAELSQLALFLLQKSEE